MNIARSPLFCRIGRLAIFLFSLEASEGRSSEYDDYRNTWSNKYAEVHAQWKKEANPVKRVDLSHILVDAAVRAECPALVEEVAADGKLAEKEIVISRDPERVALRPIRELSGIPYMSKDYRDRFIVRRITAKAFEVWTSKKGWLFDSDGRLLNEATSPKPEGCGREWFGAFLPNGQWVTTDVWNDNLSDWDGILTLFSPEGKCLKKIPSSKLLDARSKGENALIGWARSDSEGKGWVVSIGSEEGQGVARVGRNGTPELLDKIEVWKTCFKRALGPRGFYIARSIPSDDFKVGLDYGAAGHGMWVGYPTFSMENFSVCLPGAERNFGFWPKSKNIYISNAYMPKTWFFDETGRFRGWFAGYRLTDDRNGKDMLFGNKDGEVVAITPKYKVKSVRSFEWADGHHAAADTIFDDLELGLFVDHGKLVLASWKD